MELSVFSDDQFMKHALVEAEKALEQNEVPIGCVIVCNNRIIARAHNLTELLNDVTAHAEMQAITAASEHLGGKFLNECTLYVTLEPCVMCAGAIKWARFKKVVYGASDLKHGYNEIQSKIFHPKTEIIAGVLEKECATIITQFFKNKRS